MAITTTLQAKSSGGGDGGDSEKEGGGGSLDDCGGKKKMVLFMSQKLTLGNSKCVRDGWHKDECCKEMMGRLWALFSKVMEATNINEAELGGAVHLWH